MRRNIGQLIANFTMQGIYFEFFFFKQKNMKIQIEKGIKQNEQVKYLMVFIQIIKYTN